MSGSRWPAGLGVVATAVALLLWCGVAGAQTVITAPKNRYSAAEDVQIGRQAAAQVAQQDRADAFALHPVRHAERVMAGNLVEHRHGDLPQPCRQ